MKPLLLKSLIRNERAARPLVRFHGECDWELAHTFRLNGHVVPKGFRFDGASIPRPLWWWNDPSGVAFPAAIIHDYHYKTQNVSRKYADDVFFRNLVAIGVRPTAAWLMWAAVRLFGGKAWKKHQAAASEEKSYPHPPCNLD